MDRLTRDQLEQEVESVMRERGMDRAEATVIVWLKHGETYGDGDILIAPKLSPEQRQRLGLGRSLRQVMADLGELDEDLPEESSMTPAARRARWVIGS